MMFSMARRRDLPARLSLVHARFRTPYVSIWMVGVAMTLLVLFIDLASVVAISTFSLLFWYSLANFSAFRLKIEKRLFPRIFPILGMASCLVLFAMVLFVLPAAFYTGLAFLVAGVIYYFLKKRLGK